MYRINLLGLPLVTLMALSALAVPAIAQPSADALPRVATPWNPNVGNRVFQPPIAPRVVVGSTSWSALGPAPLSESGTNVSGRIAGIAAHPTDPNTIYVAPAGGGVWKTTNGGTNWTPLTDTQSTLSMGAIAIASSNPSVLYAGTGEANNSADSNYGRGILVSTNGGSTWTLTTAGGSFNRLTTSQIAVDPTNPLVAYAAMADFGNNGLCCANTGIWKTTNGGVTWTNTTSSTLTQRAPYSAVVLDPSAPNTLYMAIGNAFSGAVDQTSNGIYKSVNGGATWTLLSAAPNGSTTGRFSLAVSKSNSSVVYASVSNPTSFAVLAVVRTNNGGTTFSTVTPVNYMGSQGWYDQWIAVDPSSSSVVYLGGAAGNNSVLRSSNSGVTWTDIHTGGVSPHVDHHAADFDANGKLLDGDDGGIFRLDSPTTPTWADLNGDLNTIQFQGIGLHPTDPNRVLGGSQDNGTELFTGGLLWTTTDGGDGGFAKFSQTNGNRAYHIAPVASFGSTNFFRRSDNGGMVWVSKTTGFVNTNTFAFYAPFVVDPSNGNRLLVGADRVYETTNGADLWAPVSTPGVGGWTVNTSISAIGLSRSDVNTVYAATAGHLFVTSNHGATWTDRPIAVGGTVSDIQVDPAVPTTAYAVISSFTTANVFKTVNGGAAWTSISANLPLQPVWSLQIDPRGALYVGADDGVYASCTSGSSWNRLGTGFPRAQVFQLEYNSTLKLLGAATHGRGAWELAPSAAANPFTGQCQ